MVIINSDSELREMEQKWDDAFRFQMSSSNNVLLYVIKNDYDPVEMGQIFEKLMRINLNLEIEIPVTVKRQLFLQTKMANIVFL